MAEVPPNSEEQNTVPSTKRLDAAVGEQKVHQPMVSLPNDLGNTAKRISPDVESIPIYQEAEVFIREYIDKLVTEIVTQSKITARRKSHEVVVIEDVRDALDGIHNKKSRLTKWWSDPCKTFGAIALGIGIQGVIGEVSNPPTSGIRGSWILGYFAVTIIGLAFLFLGYIIEARSNR